MVEQCTNFVEQAKTEEWTVGNVDRFINLGLQEFTPENGRYDMIWIQWVMGHLTDGMEGRRWRRFETFFD